MRILFRKSDDGRRCSWSAELPGRRRVEGSAMTARAGGTELPHDLAPFGVEAGPGLEHGFWNARWRALPPGGGLAVDWPTRRLPRPSERARPVPVRRPRGHG